MFPEHSCTVGIGKYCLADITADLAFVNVECRNYFNVASFVTTQIWKGQADGIIGVCPTVMDTLHQ